MPNLTSLEKKVVRACQIPSRLKKNGHAHAKPAGSEQKSGHAHAIPNTHALKMVEESSNNGQIMVTQWSNNGNPLFE